MTETNNYYEPSLTLIPAFIINVFFFYPFDALRNYLEEKNICSEKTALALSRIRTSSQDCTPA